MFLLIRFVLIFVSLIFMSSDVKKISSNKVTSTLLIEFAKEYSDVDLAKIKDFKMVEKIELFDNIEHSYFQRLYRLTIKTDNPLSVSRLKNKLKEWKNIKSVEQPQSVAMMSILPSKVKSSELEGNPYFNYQWGLENNGQIINQEIDDIHSNKVFLETGDPKGDIGWKNLQKWIDANKPEKKKIVVAVIDSGVDLDNKDLNIAVKEEECEKGEKDGQTTWYIPSFDVQDKDGDGYAGDCKGWNFTTKEETKSQENKPYDDRAHGTHVAGIIGAIQNNGYGITGVASNVEILPIKVFRHITKKEQNEMILQRHRSFGTQTDRIAKAILYAVKMNADVINMSFGWPRFSDTRHLREALRAALDANITLVAGSGNDGHNQQIYPCATKGVICVGSNDIKGSISGFSNYGGHVDLLAPGDHILSLFPEGVDEGTYENFFHRKDLGLMSGTSQSAPFVSGAVAVLKSIYPGIANDEVYARLISTALPDKKTKAFSKEYYTLGGIIKIDQAVQAKARPVIRPIFKELSRVVVDRKKQGFEFALSLKNYWTNAKNVKVVVSPSNRNGNNGASFSFKPRTVHYSSFNKGGVKKINSIFVKMLDKNAHSKYAFKVSILINGKLHGEFQHEVNVTSESPRNIRQYPVKMSEESLGVLAATGLSLETVSDDSGRLAFPEYYFLEDTESGKKIHVLARSGKDHTGNEYEEKGVFFLPNADIIKTFFVEDVNYDGQLDYVIRSTVLEGGHPKYIQYSFIDRSTLQPLYGELSHWLRPRNKPALYTKKLRWLPYQHKQLGKVGTPIWVANTDIPEALINDNPFIDQYQAPIRLFLLRPVIKEGVVHLEERLLDDDKFIKKFQTLLLKKFFRSHFEHLNPVFQEDPEWPIELEISFNSSFVQNSGKKDVMEVLFSVGEGSKYSFFVMKLSKDILNDPNSFTEGRNFSVEKSDYQGMDLSQNLTNSVVDLDQYPVKYGEEEVFIDTSYSLNPRVAFLNKNHYTKVQHSFPAEFKDKDDHFVTYVKTYKAGGVYYSFYRTRDYLYMKVSDPTGRTQGQLQRIEVVASSFLPSFYFSEALRPIYIGKKGKYQPALYIDATAMYENSVFSWVFDGKKLVAPVKYNFTVPEECGSRNPVRFGERYAYTFLCAEDKMLKLRFIELD